MEPVIWVLLGLFVLIAVLPKVEQEKPKVLTKLNCPLHTWTYNKDDRLQCTECSLIAGQIKTENGEYDE